MTELTNLIPDIQKLLVDGKEISEESAKAFGDKMASLISTRLKRDRKGGHLRMSNIGKPDRQLWYEVNFPDEGEALHPNAYMKFLIGDIVEEVVLFLASEAGHKVEGEQDELSLEGILGHRDAVIDGTTVDVKSASPYSFKKFESGLAADNDPFAYTTQIQNYIEAGQEDPIVTNKEEGAFLVVQKVTGDLTLDIHKKTNIPIRDIINHKKEVVQLKEPPERCFPDEPMGKSGNRKLGINCSYCSYKFKCWENLRGFAYATGPVWLTHVEELPRVPEIGVEDVGEDI